MERRNRFRFYLFQLIFLFLDTFIYVSINFKILEHWSFQGSVDLRILILGILLFVFTFFYKTFLRKSSDKKILSIVYLSIYLTGVVFIGLFAKNKPSFWDRMIFIHSDIRMLTTFILPYIVSSIIVLSVSYYFEKSSDRNLK